MSSANPAVASRKNSLRSGVFLWLLRARSTPFSPKEIHDDKHVPGNRTQYPKANCAQDFFVGCGRFPQCVHYRHAGHDNECCRPPSKPCQSNPLPSQRFNGALRTINPRQDGGCERPLRSRGFAAHTGPLCRERRMSRKDFSHPSNWPKALFL